MGDFKHFWFYSYLFEIKEMKNLVFIYLKFVLLVRKKIEDIPVERRQRLLSLLKPRYVTGLDNIPKIHVFMEEISCIKFGSVSGLVFHVVFACCYG